MTLETWAPNDPTGIMLAAAEALFVGEGSFRRDERLAVGRTDDTKLVLRIRAGDESAFRELVERHQSRNFRVLYGILNHRADAEDVAQDVFAKVYFSIPRFDHRSSLFTWIYRIAVHESPSETANHAALRMQFIRLRDRRRFTFADRWAPYSGPSRRSARPCEQAPHADPGGRPAAAALERGRGYSVTDWPK